MNGRGVDVISNRTKLFSVKKTYKQLIIKGKNATPINNLITNK